MIRTLPLALCALLVSNAALALSLGQIQTQSALNQKFEAAIPLHGIEPAELPSVHASLASSEAFAKAGIARPYWLTRLKFHPEEDDGGTPVIRVQSRELVQEPYVDFLIEVTAPQGKLLRQYSVLLDPPEL